MGSKIEYVDSNQIYATKYVRNSKAIGVLWGIFTICYAIIGVVSFVTPEWISNVNTSAEHPGKLGLWAVCEGDLEVGLTRPKDVIIGVGHCKGRLDEFAADLGIAFQAATVFVALAVVCALVTVLAMLLFAFCHSTTVFHICGWLQLFSAISMIAGCATYPTGWSEPMVARICGSESGSYSLGECRIGWAYFLGTIGCLDAIILATLAFILATRHIRLQADPHATGSSLFKGEMNGTFLGENVSVAGSRKSLNLHPVMMMHPNQDDTYSQFSQRTTGARHPHHHHTSQQPTFTHSQSSLFNHNFQL